jgi:hypothetical protein
MNSKSRTPLTRRSFLCGISACIPLPFLEAMQAGAATSKEPVRLVWLYTKSGMWTPKFTPTETGDKWQLTPILEPLADFQADVNILTGLRHANAFKPNPVVNRHGQDAVCHLTAADLGRVPGIAAKNGISIDQIAARSVGEHTRLPTLNLTIDSESISYNANGDRIPAESRPELVFDRMFGERTQQSLEQMERRFRRHKSILDDVMEQTVTLNSQLGSADRDKLDAYLTSLRDVERRMQIERRWAGVEAVAVPDGVQRPGAKPARRGDYVKVMMDLIALALQTDQTRIATFKLGAMGCQYPELGSPNTYHTYTHGAGTSEAARKNMIAVDRERIGHLAYFLGKLRDIPDGEHNLLHNSFVHYGAGMGKTHGEGEADGDVVPNLTAGHAGGRIRTGQHIDYGKKPLTNLYVSMLQSAGVEMGSFVDSEGALDAI